MIEVEINDSGSPWMSGRGDMFECEGTLHVLLSHCTAGICDGEGVAYQVETLMFCDGNEKPLYFKGIVKRDKIRRVKDINLEVNCV